MSARPINKNKDRDSDYIASPEHKVFPLAKRQKAARACDRCRLHRIKCDQQKPCTQCVAIKAQCIVSYAPSYSSQANNSDVGHARSELASVPRSTSPLPSPTHTTCRGNKASTSSSTTNTTPSAPPSSMIMSQQSSWATSTLPDTVPNEVFNLAHVHGFFASGQPASSHSSASAGCIFPQLPHPAVPSGERLFVSDSLLKTQRSYYLRLFWDACHPLLQIMSETEFAKLDALPPPAIFDEYSTRNALVDSMLALGIQHSHTTGLAGRILGLQQPPSRQYCHVAASPGASWPGFEYFNRCRACMRTNTEVTMEALRCHALMVVYLMKGNAFRDAYNLLGITIRKAYVVKLHRLPPSHLPESGKTSHMQLWWMLFSLDLQCSLQLDMPAASQKSLVKCPFPTEDGLARYVSSPSHCEERVSPYMYTTGLVNLASIVTDIAACFSTADLDEGDSNSPTTFEHHALKLSSTLQNLEIWHDQLPSGLRLNQGGNVSGNAEVLDFDRDLSLPIWLRRQRVLLELHYHNAYTLIQRPFIRLRYTHSSDPSEMITPPDSRQPQTELHITSALYHATMVIDIVFTVCSTSEVLYGWSEVLQPLWNATLTIMAYVYANSLSSVVPHALDSLTRAQAVFESFSSTCPSAHSAKGILQSLASSLQIMTAQGSSAVPNNDQIDWDLFTSLLEEKAGSCERH